LNNARGNINRVEEIV
jgi:chromosome segregation ATPase